jgi:hypothetical protein
VLAAGEHQVVHGHRLAAWLLPGQGHGHWRELRDMAGQPQPDLIRQRHLALLAALRRAEDQARADDLDLAADAGGAAQEVDVTDR